MLGNTQLTKEENLQRKLRTAMKYAKDTCILGSTNRIEDIIRTGGWSFMHQYRYNQTGKYVQVKKKNHEANDMKACNMKFNLKTRQFEQVYTDWYYRVADTNKSWFCTTPIMLEQVHPAKNPQHGSTLLRYTPTVKQVLRALSTRSGNCGVMACLVTKYLWEKPDGIHRIEYFSMVNFDHAFVVVNRSGDADKPDTWGNAWIVDSWTKDGLICPASEFYRYIRETKCYCKYQVDEFGKIGISYEVIDHSKADSFSIHFDIHPQTEAYPRNNPYDQIEDFYNYDDFRYTLSGQQLKRETVKAQHAAMFNSCLVELKMDHSLPKYGRLFRIAKRRQQQHHHENTHDQFCTIL